MSNSNSLSDSGGIDLPSQYALRVALQTMKERCIALQQRLSTVEEENTVLRNQTIPINSQNPELNILRDCKTEVDNLRKQIEELAQQKLQLTEHISMVATENRQLWSRLSQLAKDDTQKEQKKQIAETIRGKNQQSTPSSGQNLIRSRTFTQNSPNPLLRQKHLAALAAGATLVGDKSLNDLSLEEISLRDVNEDEINDVGGDDGDENNIFNSKVTAAATSNILGFGYLNDDSSDGIDDNDLGTEAKKCIDNMIDIKKEVLKQHDELTATLNVLKEKKVFVQQECIECKLRNNNKPEMADKIIETRDDLTGESLKTLNSVPAPINNHIAYSNRSKIIDGEGGKQGSEGLDNVDHLNILEMKRCADRMDKICPMCGKIFGETVLFSNFQEHVETHFTDDTDFDPNAFERNFELVSHSVGDF